MPTYAHTCVDCCLGQDVICAIADRDKNYLCNSCNGDLVRQLSMPMVMKQALPDGTKRFSDLRQRIALDRARKWNLDKTEKSKINRELSKLNKES